MRMLVIGLIVLFAAVIGFIGVAELAFDEPRARVTLKDGGKVMCLHVYVDELTTLCGMTRKDGGWIYDPRVLKETVVSVEFPRWR